MRDPSTAITQFISCEALQGSDSVFPCPMNPPKGAFFHFPSLGNRVIASRDCLLAYDRTVRPSRTEGALSAADAG